jgi:cysteine desulfurase
MWANNETGVLQPMEAISELVRSHGALLFTDATQAVGKVPVGIAPVDLLACSGHKVYGPKGIGALYVRRRDPRVRLVPLLDGGGQERGRRGGTLNTPGIVGLGSAVALGTAEHEADAARLGALRDRLEAALLDALPGTFVNGAEAPRLPQTSSLTFPGVPAANLIAALRGLAVSTGSACTSGSGKPSHVLKAHGLSDADALSTLRFSLGRNTTPEEIDYTIAQVTEAVERLRSRHPSTAVGQP